MIWFAVAMTLSQSARFFRFSEVAESGFRFVEAAADAVSVVGVFGKAVHGDNDSVETGGYELLGEVLCERLGVGGDDGIESRFVGLANHGRQVFIEEGLSLEIELDDKGGIADFGEDAMPDFRRSD